MRADACGALPPWVTLVCQPPVVPAYAATADLNAVPSPLAAVGVVAKVSAVAASRRAAPAFMASIPPGLVPVPAFDRPHGQHLSA